jgi:hypothetical protein
MLFSCSLAFPGFQKRQFRPIFYQYFHPKLGPVWHGIYRRFSDAIPQAVLEESAASYSAEELEQWVLKRAGVGESWTSEHLLPENPRIIQRRCHDVMHLVRGGRRLLVVLAPGEITVYDLEVPEITGRILVEPQSDMDRQLVRQLAVDIDGESLVLTF